MSFFSIKVKTKSGNDIKKKETMTAYFRISYKNNALTRKKTAEYTYRIMHSGGIEDPRRVLEIKDVATVLSTEDLTLRVMLNMFYILTKITEKHNINPDFIMLVSPDLDGKKNKSWIYLKSIFKRVYDRPAETVDEFTGIRELQAPYELEWDEKQCEKLGIRREDLDKLKAFVDLNPNTVFMNVDPNIDKVKYSKSLGVCQALQDRMDRKFEQDADY